MSTRSPESILIPYQLRAVRIGVQATLIVLAGLLLYLLLPGRPPLHLAGYSSALVVAAAGAVLVHFLPWQRLFQAGLGPATMYAWSVADIVLVSVAIVFSGGQHSAVYLTYLLTTVFFAASYPLRGQIVLFAFTVLSYLAVLVAVEPQWEYATLAYRFVGLIAVMFMSSFLSQELSRQMQAHGGAREEAEQRSTLLAEVARSARGLHGASAAHILQTTADAARRLGFDYAAIAAGRPDDGPPHVICVSGESPAADEDPEARPPRSLDSLPDSLLRLVLPFQTEAGPPMTLLLLSERVHPPTAAEREALDLLISRAGRALDAAGHSEELRRREERFRSLLQHSSDLITVLDADGRVTYQSDSSRAVLGAEPSPMLGSPFEAVVHPNDRDQLAELLGTVLASEGTRPENRQVRVRTKDGWRHIEILATNRLDDPAVAGIVLNGRDVSEHVRLAEQLREQALHDPLTGMPNRTLLAQRLEAALAERGPERAVGLLFIDLDDFKRINDLFGHASGDRFLSQVARYFGSALGPEDTVARFGGDEFVLVLGAVSGVADVERKAEALLAGLSTSLRGPAEGLSFTASAGIVVVPHGEEVGGDELLYRADIAMYHAKRSGKARFAVFDAEMAADLLGRHGFEIELRAAVERDEFELHYQPMVSLQSGAITGVEALVRWRHPVRGILLPEEFLYLAEEIGLMGRLGRIVLRTAIGQLSAWRAGHPALADLRLNVNIAPSQLRDASLPGEIEQLLVTHGVPPHLLVLEMTEEALTGDVDDAARALQSLKALGLRLAVDDFGTGYSSLAYLHAFPLDILKIDRSFVKRLGQNDGETLVAAIVDLAARLRLEATAEGIESEAQLQYLRNQRCALGQGFLLARPLAGEDALELILSDADGHRRELRRSA